MIVNCVAYENGSRLRDIPPAEISEVLQRPGAFVWVALFEPSEDELQLFQEEFSLPAPPIEAPRHGHQRPKVEEYGELLFAVMHTVEREGDDLRVGEMDVFVGHNFLLSVRSRCKQ